MKKRKKLGLIVLLTVIIVLFIYKPRKVFLSAPQLLISLPQKPYVEYVPYWSKDGSQILLTKATWTAGDTQKNIDKYWLFNSNGNFTEYSSSINEDLIQSDYIEYHPQIQIEDRVLFCNFRSKEVKITNIKLSNNTDWEFEVSQGNNSKGLFSPSKSQKIKNNPYIFFSLSPNCDFLTVTLSGDTKFETSLENELWLLDIPNNQFSHILTGYEPVLESLNDTTQDVTPSWSPDSTEFVFGGGTFGVEVYNIATKNREWTLMPVLYDKWYTPQWSPSGNWIALKSYNENPSVMIISPNGRYYMTEGNCYNTFTEWGPHKDELLFICFGDRYQSFNLWKWNIPEIK